MIAWQSRKDLERSRRREEQSAEVEEEPAESGCHAHEPPMVDRLRWHFRAARYAVPAHNELRQVIDARFR